MTEIGRIHRTDTTSIVIVVMIQGIEIIIIQRNHQNAIRADQDIATVEVSRHRTMLQKVILDIINVTVEANRQATVRGITAAEADRPAIIVRVTMMILIDLIDPRNYLNQKQDVILVNTHKQSTVLFRMNRLVQIM